LPSVYVFANVDVTDPQQYEAYKKLSTVAIQKYGAQVCVRGGAVEVLEGDWTPQRIVLLKFPSREQAKTFYDSPEYRAAKKAREGAATMRMVLVDGV
jgi:uncharacterized protein (DUF1330 family)